MIGFWGFGAWRASPKELAHSDYGLGWGVMGRGQVIKKTEKVRKWHKNARQASSNFGLT